MELSPKFLINTIQACFKKSFHWGGKISTCRSMIGICDPVCFLMGLWSRKTKLFLDNQINCDDRLIQCNWNRTTLDKIKVRKSPICKKQTNKQRTSKQTNTIKIYCSKQGRVWLQKLPHTHTPVSLKHVIPNASWQIWRAWTLSPDLWSEFILYPKTHWFFHAVLYLVMERENQFTTCGNRLLH